MKNTTKLSLAFLTMLFVVSWCFPAYAGVQGHLVVTIKDTAGKPIQDVTITLTSQEVGTKQYTITTNKKGVASIAGIDPEQYSVKAEKEGYQYLEGPVKLRAGVKVKQKWTMKTIEEAKEEAKNAAWEKLSEEEKNKIHAEEAHNQGVTAYQNGKIDEAKTNFKKAIELFPDVSYLDYLLLGQFAFNEKNVDEAIPYLEKARALDTKGEGKLDISRLLGVCYMIKEQLDKAKEIWSDMVKEAPDPTVLYNLANIEIKKENYDGAIEWLVLCREKNPDYVDGLTLLGDVYIQQNKYDKGLEVYEQLQVILEKDPGANAEALKNAKDTVKLLKEMQKK